MYGVVGGGGSWSFVGLARSGVAKWLVECSGVARAMLELARQLQ